MTKIKLFIINKFKFYILVKIYDYCTLFFNKLAKYPCFTTYKSKQNFISKINSTTPTRKTVKQINQTRGKRESANRYTRLNLTYLFTAISWLACGLSYYPLWSQHTPHSTPLPHLYPSPRPSNTPATSESNKKSTN